MDLQETQRTNAPLDPDVQLKTLATLIRRRWMGWVRIIAICSTLLFVLVLVSVSQSYTAQLSLSVAQTKGAGASLQAAQLGFSPSPSARYVGILKSRRFAQEVERKVNLQQLYHLASPEDAVDMIQAGLTVNDNPRDGLLYISLVLPGPPRFGLRSNPTRETVKSTVSTATNLYEGLLKEYVVTSDNDADTILLNLAAEQITKTRREYDTAVKALADFVRSRPTVSSSLMHPSRGAASEATAETGGLESDSQAKSLLSLYSARANSEQEIQALEAEMRTGGLLRAEQLRNLAALPAEDPLLIDARNRRNSARASLDSLQLQFGPENPKVVVAREELAFAEKRLQDQTETVRQGKTSRDVDVRVKLDSVKSRHEVILSQIADMEHNAHIDRLSLTDYEMRRNEVMFRLDVLKVTASQAATLSLQVVSAQNRVRVVDNAMPPRKGSPGIVMMALLSLFLALFGVICRVTYEYAEMVRSMPASGRNDIKA